MNINLSARIISVNVYTVVFVLPEKIVYIVNIRAFFSVKITRLLCGFCCVLRLFVTFSIINTQL